MEGAVQLFQKSRLSLDLNSLLQLFCLQNVPVPVGNLRPEILVVQSAQNWHRQRAIDSLDGTRNRRVLMQR
jgi:hypothetical protein